MQSDDKICLCFGVTRRQVEKHVRLEKPARPSQLSECYGAGTGCGWCRPFLRKIFDSLSDESMKTAESHSGANGGAAGIEISAEEYASQRAEFRRSKEAADD